MKITIGRAQARTWLAAGTAVAALAVLGCGFGGRTSEGTPAGPSNKPEPQTTTAGGGSTATPEQHTQKDARFTVTRRGLAGVDPSNMKVSCAAIDYAVILTDASVPFHWRIRKDDRLRSVTTVPAEGDLSPGGQTIIRVRGSYDGRTGDELIVYVWSEDSTQSSGIQMYCR
jgi:hypothetical protein